MNRRFTVFLCLSLLPLWVFTQISFSQLKALHHVYASNTIVVPDDYQTIQAAIDATQEGCIISVKPGIYNECIRITKKSIKIIGSGNNNTEIFSTGTGHTIELARGANNVTIRGFRIKGTKISLLSGIYIRSLYNIIENNLITDHYYGIHIYDSTCNTLRNNSLTQNRYNLAVWGLFLPHFLNDIDTSNKVNGKPVHYLLHQKNITISSADGYLALVNSSDVTVEDRHLSDNQCGILLAYTNDCLINNVTTSHNEYGLYLVCSSRNTITKNNINNNNYGIVIISSEKNTISRNTLEENNYDGLRLSHSYPLLSKYSEKTTIIENHLSNNGNGIYFEASHNNIATGNNVTNNRLKGITLDESEGNIITRNKIKNNSQGIYVYSSNNNILYHNSVIDNSIHVYNFTTSINQWDCGYPCGGNFWTDYKGADMFRGLFHNITGSDGIGDTSYTIDKNNKDNYPLMGAFYDFNTTLTQHVQTICNSTISDFQFNGSAISFNVTGDYGTTGFCRICVPKALINDTCSVLVNGIEVPHDLLPCSNTTHSYIYFTYNHSTQEVVVIPEFSSLITLLLFMMATILAVLIFRGNSLTKELEVFKAPSMDRKIKY